MRFGLLILVCTVGLSMSWSQTRTGTLSGSVRDEETSQPLAGANVAIRGTVLGAASDAGGSFRVKGIPPGVYTVTVSIVGYQRLSFAGIEISAGSEQSLHAKLKPTIIQTEQIVVTASRREESLKNVSVSVATVSAEDIANRNIVTLDDALRYVPGVNLLQDQINIRGSSGYSRGIGSRVLLLLDGIPYITGDTGEINWETLPTYQVERIEVVKGAGSALYGSSALGGVVNVITKDIEEKPSLQFRVYSGVYDKPRFAEWDWSPHLRLTSGGMVTFSGRSGGWGYLVSVARSVDEGYRQNDAYHRWNFFSKVKVELTSFSDLTITANYLTRTHGNFFWWKNLREATRPATAQLNGKIDVKRGNVGFAYKQFVSDDFFYTLKGLYYGNFWQDDSAGRMNNRSTSHQFTVEGQGVYKINKSNILTFGLGANSDHVTANLFGTHPGVGFAAYAQNEFSLSERTKLTGGIRYDAQQVSALPFVGQFNPKLGIVHTLDDQTTLRASLGTGYRYPSIGELFITSSISVSQIIVIPNPDLQVEKSLTMEIGMSRSLGERVFVDAALFSNSFENLIEAGVKIRKIRRNPEDLEEVELPVIQFENVTQARIQGGEIGIKIHWLKKVLTSDVGYTYIWPWDVSEQTVLKFRPRHLLFGTTTLTYEALTASVDYRFVSRIERIDENLVRLAPIIHGDQRVDIHVVDARVSYDESIFGLPLRVGLHVKNVMNYHYVELIGNLAPVRTFFLSISGII